MSIVEIAIIDDGVNFSLLKDIYNNEKKAYIVDNRLSVRRRHNFCNRAVSHGTQCAAILLKYFPLANLTSIQVLDNKSKRCNVDKLVSALYWCSTHGISLVNLSLGSVNFRDADKIENCIGDIAARGMVVVAAISNENVYTLPASLSHVIGVTSYKSDSNCSGYDFCVNSFLGIDVVARSTHEVRIGSRKYSTKRCNSFAAPYIASKIALILESNPKLNLNEIKTILFEQANNFDASINYSSQVLSSSDWIMYAEESADIEIPVALVVLNEEMVLSLRNSFRKDGYFAIYARDNNESCNLPADELIPAHCITKDFLKAIYQKYNCDIILVNASTAMILDLEKVFFDMKIYRNQDGSFSVELYEAQKTIRIDKESKLYSIVKSYLTS